MPIPYIIKHAVLFKLSTSQTCPQVDSALHILSGCQLTQIRNMITERHNLACRVIFKAISKTGSLRSCVVPIEIGSNERMTIQNLQIPETAESRLFPNGSSHPASQIRQTHLQPPRFCAGYSYCCKNTITTNQCRGVGSSKWQGAIEGDWEHLSSTDSH